MTYYVADVGNSRVKWGRCSREAVVESAALPPADLIAWTNALIAWSGDRDAVGEASPAPKASRSSWTIAGVNPPVTARLAEWLRAQGATVAVIDSYRRLPITIAVEHPESVGLDRLLNAVAANSRRTPGQPAIVIDAGSAVTVDWLDAEGVFRGGAIFPGVRLMAQALHEYTARLPLVELSELSRSTPSLVPGTSTVPAIQAGIHAALVGGVRYLIERMAANASMHPRLYLTGGDAARLASELPCEADIWPTMTLEGIRLAGIQRSASRGEHSA